LTTTPTDHAPSDRIPVLEEVVATLTSAAGAGYGGAAALRAGMRRATDQFDEHAAAALARSLVDCLCKSPDDVRVLETLVILGLAHPGALAQHRISLVHEGRRLAYLLEKAGQFERAYCLGELIAERAPVEMIGVSAEDSVAVEQLVRDAEFAAARGRTDSAIRCLEEASKIDPSRQDLPRAIRDLRRKKEFNKAGGEALAQARVRRRPRLGDLHDGHSCAKCASGAAGSRSRKPRATTCPRCARAWPGSTSCSAASSPGSRWARRCSTATS
jgi:hypothetical protein